MSYLEEGYYSDRPIAANALPAERVTFIRRTYAHLAGAILAFAALETLLITSGVGLEIMRTLFGGSGGMLVLMVLFIGGGYLAQYWAHAATSRAMQYAGLGLYVLLQAIICLPLLYIASTSPYFEGQNIIAKAGLLTLGVFAGLSVAVFLTRQDFSFLGPVLSVAGFLALGLILIAMFFPGTGLGLGTWFSFAMVGLAAAFIIYDTSNVLHHYRTDQYVGAALQLFASVALMFFYILRIMLSSSSRD
jgi:FtsH-binding integral membrane protein